MLHIMKNTNMKNGKDDSKAYRFGGMPAFCLVAGVLWGGAALAAPPTIVVNSPQDPGTNSDQLCTLREAIMVVEGTDQQTGCALPKGRNPKITFAPGLTGKITLTSTLTISKPVTIEGPGPDKIVIDAAGNISTPRRAFEIHSTGPGVPTLNLSGVWVQNGYWPASGGEGGGGAFLVYTTGAALKLSNCIVSNNVDESVNGGGAILVREGTSATIDNCVFFKNSATGGEGGAIKVSAMSNLNSSLTVTNSKFFDNESASWGAAVFTQSVGVGDPEQPITTASTSIDASQFYDNSAQNPGSGGGAIANWGTSQGGNATTTVSNSLVGGNDALYSPGGIYNLATNSATATMTVTGSSVVANTSGDGLYTGMDILSEAGFGSIATLNVSNSTVFDCALNGTGTNQGTGCP